MYVVYRRDVVCRVRSGARQVRPAARSRPMSETVCPVSLRARAPRPRVGVSNSRRLSRPADGACESVQVARGYSRSRRARLPERDAATRARRAARGRERDSHKSGAPRVGVRARVGRRCTYKRKGIIFACIFHDSIRRWNF